MPASPWLRHRSCNQSSSYSALPQSRASIARRREAKQVQAGPEERAPCSGRVESREAIRQAGDVEHARMLNDERLIDEVGGGGRPGLFIHPLRLFGPPP